VAWKKVNRKREPLLFNDCSRCIKCVSDQYQKSVSGASDWGKGLSFLSSGDGPLAAQGLMDRQNKESVFY